METSVAACYASQVNKGKASRSQVQQLSSESHRGMRRCECATPAIEFLVIFQLNYKKPSSLMLYGLIQTLLCCDGDYGEKLRR
jgi:hypothetical protein